MVRKRKLKEFDGTEEELKQLLYNERYFNTRVGRKARYSQWDLTAYFQDVIPEANIHQDFDLANDVWHGNFDVDPTVRKGEFRLFNAPENPREAALHIKFVRALLNKSLNEDPRLTGVVQSVDYERAVQNPKAALREF